jgi:hypothetical protein
MTENPSVNDQFKGIEDGTHEYLWVSINDEPTFPNEYKPNVNLHLL